MKSIVPLALAAIAGGFLLCTLGPRESACYTEREIRREAEYRQYRWYRDQGNQMMYLDEAERADIATRKLIREGGDSICGEHPATPSPGEFAEGASSQ